MRVLIGHEFSGVIREAFRALGHDAMSCDMIPSEQPGPHYQGDVFDVIDYPWDLAIFHPPCTHTAVSGARHFAAKQLDGRQQAGVSHLMQVSRRAAHIPHWCIEQPISVISSLWRKPDQIIQPHEYGHGETKAICLWLHGLPRLIATNPVEGRKPRVHYESPGPDRWKNRSRTFPGIARAMAEQWGNL